MMGPRQFLVFTIGLVLLFLPTGVQGADCKGFKKGSWDGDVKDKQTCGDACKKAEGGEFECGDFKGEEGTAKCECASKGCKDPRRSLCEDKGYAEAMSSEATSSTGMKSAFVFLLSIALAVLPNNGLL